MTNDESKLERQATPKFYNTEEFRREILGERLSKAALYAAIKKGEIPVVRFGKRILILGEFAKKITSL